MHLLWGVVFSVLASSGLARPAAPSNPGLVKPRAAGYAPKQPPLTTEWTDKVGTNPWPEYPRPQLQRSQWQNLNGVWKYQNASSLDAVQNPPFEQNLGQEVLIPSCLESGLSGMTYVDVVVGNELRVDGVCRNPGKLHFVFVVFNLVPRFSRLERRAYSAALWGRGL